MIAAARAGAFPRSTIWAWTRPKLDLILVGAFMIALLFLPKGIPGGSQDVRNLGGVAGLGLVSASSLALQGLGMVLILRSTRIISFAQIQLGAVTGLVFFELLHHNQFVLVYDRVCNSCLRGLPNDAVFLQSHPQAFQSLLQVHGYFNLMVANFWVSLILSFLIAPFLSWLIYMGVVRRFDRAPRLMVTVVTLAVASFLVQLANLVPSTIFGDVSNDTISYFQPIPDAGCHGQGVDHVCGLYIQPALFHIGDILTLVAAVLVAVLLVAFFRFSRTGVAMRSVADNAPRAQTLGIAVASLSSFSWVMAGALSGLAAVLVVIQNGAGGIDQASLQVGPLVQVLAAVVIARLTNMPLVVIAAACLGIAQQVFLWNFGTDVAYDSALLILIGGVLLLQAARQSRAERGAAASYLSAREARPIPRELRRLPVVDGYVRWFGIIVAVLVLGLPFAVSPSQVSLGSVVLIYTIIGLSLLVLTGWAGQISLGQFAFAAVGGYVATIVAARTGLFMLVDLFVGGAAGAIIAVIVGVPALRLRGLYLGVSTLAFALATTSVLLNPDALGQFLPASLDRPDFLGFDLNDERVFFYLSLFFLILAFVAVVGLRRSRTARALIACRDNEEAAQSLGISLFRTRLEALAISGFLAAFAGALFAYHQRGIQPIAFAPIQSINIFMIVIIGGLGSPVGPLLGAVYQGLIILSNSPVVSALLSGGAGVLIVLLFFPNGMSGIAYALRDAWLRRVAIRYRVSVPSLLGELNPDSLENQSLIAPKMHTTGGVAFVPKRYRLDGQWDKFAEDVTASA